MATRPSAATRARSVSKGAATPSAGAGIVAWPTDGAGSSLTVSNSDFSFDIVQGGNGAQGSVGGNGEGGGIYSSYVNFTITGGASLTVTGATLFFDDQALAGQGGANSANPPVGEGGGIDEVGSVFTITPSVLFLENKATTSGKNIFQG